MLPNLGVKLNVIKFTAKKKAKTSYKQRFDPAMDEAIYQIFYGPGIRSSSILAKSREMSYGIPDMYREMAWIMREILSCLGVTFSRLEK